MDKVKKLFISTYFRNNNYKGDELFTRFKNTLAIWVDALIDQMRYTNKDMQGLKLTVPTYEKNHTIPAVLQTYFEYMYDTHGEYPMVFRITNINNWNNFIQYKMQSEQGYQYFWKSQKKT